MYCMLFSIHDCIIYYVVFLSLILVYFLHIQACFTPGMFLLGAKGSKNEKHFINLAAEIANTCHESYRKTGNLSQGGSHQGDPLLRMVTLQHYIM